MTESTLTIWIGNFWASLIAKSVLPDAVGPKRKATGGLILISFSA